MTSPRLLSLSRLLTTTTTATTAASTFTRRLTTTTAAPTRLSLLRRISTITPHHTTLSLPTTRAFSTNQAQNSMNDNNANWSNRPPKETIMLDGCDFEHWLVVTDPPPEDWTRDQIIDYYVQTLAEVLGGEAEARMKIYSVSTKHYFAFGALVDEETSYKIKELEKVRWVLPDSYLDVKNKDYGGEPFIDGQAVPYDPKYHEEWVRNNQKAKERNIRNTDRPRNNDRSRNFDRRQRTGPPGPNMGGPPQPNQIGPGQPNNFQQNMPPNNFQQNMPANNVGYQPNPQPNNVGYQGNMPPNNYQPNIPPPNNGGYQQNMAPPNPNAASYQPNMPLNPPPPNVSGNYGAQGYSNNAAPNYQAGGVMPYQNVPGRDMP